VVFYCKGLFWYKGKNFQLPRNNLQNKTIINTQLQLHNLWSTNEIIQKHPQLTNMHFCNACLAQQVPVEILTEILFLGITYTGLNRLCKPFKTNQSSILNINSYALSDTPVFANELIKTHTFGYHLKFTPKPLGLHLFIEMQVV